MEHTERVAEEERANPPDDTDVRAVGPAGGASKRSDRTLYEILDDFAERIPPEIKDQFPEDFIENMDHYLYGAGKKCCSI